jgi:hypothetical protein
VLNLKRGFRRLLLVLSVVWVGVSSLYLWPLNPSSPSWRDAPVIQPAGTAPSVEGSVPPLPPGFVLDQPTARPSAADDKWETVSGPSPRGGDVFDLDALLAREKAQHDRERRARFRSFLEIALLPPIIAFALFESLLWTARGFSAKQAVSKPEK